MYKFEYDGNKTWISPKGYTLDESKELFYKQTHWEDCMAKISLVTPVAGHISHSNKLINTTVKRFKDFIDLCEALVSSASKEELYNLKDEISKIDITSPWLLYDPCVYLKEALDERLSQLENKDS